MRGWCPQGRGGSSPPSDTTVMSRDILDGCRGRSRTRSGVESGSVLDLILLGGIDGEGGEEFAVFVDDSDVAVGDEEHDAGAGVASSDPEVAEDGCVAEGDLAVFVDAVASDPVLGRDRERLAARGGLGS